MHCNPYTYELARDEHLATVRRAEARARLISGLDERRPRRRRWSRSRLTVAADDSRPVPQPRFRGAP
jgi:hypothetical protein